MEISESSYIAFLDVWHEAMWYLFLLAAAISVISFLVYQIRYATAGDLKAKYDLASKFEIKNYLRANYILAAGIFFFLNTLEDETVTLSPIWFFIRIFVCFCLGTLHVYIAYLVFKYYYPAPLNKKLKRLRLTPRVNPSTGNKMKLLSEEDEDAYLDEGMQAEENAFSVDYDVWIDPANGDTKIEKYQGHLSAEKCDRCGFQTLKLHKEEILEPASEFGDGQLEKEYKCGYCGRIKRKTVKLTFKMDKSASTPGTLVSNPLTVDTNNQEIEMVMVTVHSTDGKSKNFEFQNIQQAQHFLDEFDYNKLSNN